MSCRIALCSVRTSWGICGCLSPTSARSWNQARPCKRRSDSHAQHRRDTMPEQPFPLVKARSFCQLHNSLGGGNAPQGGMEVVLVPLLETAPPPDPALDPEAALIPDVALDPENAVLSAQGRLDVIASPIRSHPSEWHRHACAHRPGDELVAPKPPDFAADREPRAARRYADAGRDARRPALQELVGQQQRRDR